MRSSVRLAVIALILAAAPHAFAASEEYYNYLEGLIAERSGNMTKALDSYEKVVAQDPHALQVYRDIAELNMRLGKPEAALKAAERVKELAPKDPSSFIFLGNVHVAQGNLAKAAEAYEDALKIDPTNLRALENLGNYYAILNPDKALTYYERYLDVQPRDPDLYFQMALVYQKKGNAAKARALHKKSLELDPHQLAAHLALADLYEQEKSTAAAIAEYTAATEIQPANPIVWMRLGHLYYRNQQWEDATRVFEAVRALAPQDATVYYWLARACEERKDWKRAAAHVEKAYALSQDAQFLPLVAYYLTLDRQVENAVRWLDKARAADPENANVLLFLGINNLDLGKIDAAHAALSKGVGLYPRDPQMRFHLGIAEDRLGHFDEAVKQFKALLADDPKNAAALNYLGYSWADRGENLEEAEKLLRQAVALEPENGAYLDSLGWVRFKRGDPRQAREYLEKAVERSPDPLIYEHLGDAYLAAGHPEPAVQAWTKALSLDPKNEALRKKIKEASAPLLTVAGRKKYFKYLEGGLRQAQNLRSDVSIQARWAKRRIRADGQFYYARPDRVIVDVAATDKRPGLRLRLHEGTVRVDPPQPAPALQGLSVMGLTSLSQFFSGQLTDSMDARVDPKTGMHTRFSRENPSGGRDEVEVVAYDYVEGVWLPTEMRLRNTTMGWDARLAFSQWTLNDAQTAKAFHSAPSKD